MADVHKVIRLNLTRFADLLGGFAIFVPDQEILKSFYLQSDSKLRVKRK